MSLSTQHIVRHLFRVESLEEVSRQQLEELVANYPSFGVGRYLLSQKLQAEGADNFVEETQKTNLYFTNPFWLQWLLQDAKTAADGNGLTHVVTERAVPAEEVFAPVVDTTEETLETEVVHVEEPDEVGTPPVEVEMQGEPSAADELLKSIAALQDQRRESQQAEYKEAVTEELSQGLSIAGLALGQLEEHAEPVVTGHLEGHAVEDIHFVERNPAEEQATEMVAGEPEEAGEDGKQVWETEGNEAAEPEREGNAEQTAGIEEQPEAALHGGDGARLVMDDAGVTTNEKPVEEPALFEPYHTIDYFASQGIRLVLEDNPTDRLGQQMKSFTDWLKIMRRLPQKNREIIPDIAAEHHVQAIAAHSIERKEIITETMAEVLAKQGMREKATEMYRKLSLLEPQKSAYFAEKIEKLKII